MNLDRLRGLQAGHRACSICLEEYDVGDSVR